ncbi:MAG TPA: DUF427 domain-containing protein [Rhodoblastus sp.]|nr:DUF427 domain-containing protein [Rhodoblastus sp.]
MPVALKTPDASHPITIAPSQKRVRVLFNGKVVADTTRALDLKEASYPVVRYIPRADADLFFFKRSARTTHCPYKGDASYFSLVDGERRAENAVWTYEAPGDAVAAIAGHLAFYPDKVEIEVS